MLFNFKDLESGSKDFGEIFCVGVFMGWTNDQT